MGGHAVVAGFELTLRGVTDDCVIAAAAGPMDYLNLRTLHADAQALLRPGRRLVLDLSQVDFFDSSGLNTLLRLHRQAAELGGSLALTQVPARVRQILALTGTDTVLKVYATPDDAVTGPVWPGDAGHIPPGE
ncbi:STAS domain-containing protein [Streptomyces sp. NPDC051636]|uniref:STAS domain-containing protein n=1 Tax=Streptomyces sp. NPDC051636 TaxID=3365663 RepID=UPI0037ABCAE7